jgi:hypothetical protein
MSDKDQFVRARWTCATCCADGNVRVWVRPGEQPEQAVTRHADDTRGRCIKGCRYSVVGPKPKPKAIVSFAIERDADGLPSRILIGVKQP